MEWLIIKENRNRIIRFSILFICFYLLTFENVMLANAATMKHNQRFADCYVEYGIDVSYHQGEIDWEKVKKAGVRFAFIRVARRTLDDGSLGMDTRAIENIEGASAVGIPIGVYIFSQAVTQREAIEEANYIINAIEPYRDKITLPVVLDYEYADVQGNSGRLQKANLSRKNATNNCLVFCNAVKEAGYTPMVYASSSMLLTDLDGSFIEQYYPIWLAHYTYETDYPGEYSYWQYSSNGRVNGIEGRVDLNVHYVEAAEGAAIGLGEELQEYNEYVYTYESEVPKWVFYLAGLAGLIVLSMAGIVIGVWIKEKRR